MSKVKLPLLNSLLWRKVPTKSHLEGLRIFHRLQRAQNRNATWKHFSTISSRAADAAGGISAGLKAKHFNYNPMLVRGLHEAPFLSGNCKFKLIDSQRTILSAKNGYQVRFFPTLNQIRKQKPRTKKKKPKLQIPKDKKILIGPQRKGVCVKLVVRTPKKPNSAQRKCAILRLSNGKLITAYIPGEKGVLQEHGVVLFEGGRVQDCPGIKYKIIRRKYDMN